VKIPVCLSVKSVCLKTTLKPLKNINAAVLNAWHQPGSG
jgi:hypothetical protein